MIRERTTVPSSEETTLDAAEAEPPAPRGVRVRIRSENAADLESIGRFRILTRLGAGGMGVVYRARDPSLNREVAIKVVGGKVDSAARDRLLHEAQAMARVQHPNVVHVHEAGRLGDEVFIVMELIRGATTLSDWLQSGSHDWRARCQMLIGAAHGLAAAHAAGIVHRDVKPDNIMVGTDARPRLLDFGLARSVDAGVALDPGAAPEGGLGAVTRVGAFAGTPGYMSPEQWEGGAVDQASDQFSLCVMAYRMLWNQPPFEGTDVSSLRASVLAGGIRPPPASDVPAEVTNAVCRGLSRNPEDRWPSVEAFAEAVSSAVRRDPDADIGRGKLIRVLFAAFVVVLSLNRARIIIQRGVPAVDLDVLRLQALLALGGLILLGIALRHQIRATSYNRRVMGLFASGALSLALHRILMREIGAPVQHVLVGDLALFFGLFCSGATSVERRMWWLAALAAAATVAGAVSATAAVLAFPLLTAVAAIVLIFLWRDSSAASRPTASGGASQSGKSIS